MRIVTEEAEPVTKVRQAVPPNVAAAVAKSLTCRATAPDQRWVADITYIPTAAGSFSLACEQLHAVQSAVA